ncbi:hypothetical protein [Paraburkholderia bannensis]|uniref:hypothetical protein n=1 Tax=Paraburkholderia bannensis TaxID=765414 RepID=UPI0005A67D04|nr:hypothetical protein [Paraburkholderia bannensis]
MAYVAAFIAGSLTIATVTFVTWLIENGFNPSRDRHLFVATFIFPFLAAGVVSLAVLAPLLSPIYAFSIIAIQKWLDPVLAGLHRSWHCLRHNGVDGDFHIPLRHFDLFPLSLTSISHIPLAPMIEIVAIGAASGMTCRSVLLR